MTCLYLYRLGYGFPLARIFYQPCWCAGCTLLGARLWCMYVGCAVRTVRYVDGGTGCVLYVRAFVCDVFLLPVGSDVVRVTHPTVRGNGRCVGKFRLAGGAERKSMVVCRKFCACRDVGCVIRTAGSIGCGTGCGYICEGVGV